MNKPNPARDSRGPELTQVRWMKGRGIRSGKEEDHPGPPCAGRLTFAERLPDACGLNGLSYRSDRPYRYPICRYPFDVNLRADLPVSPPPKLRQEVTGKEKWQGVRPKTGRVFRWPPWCAWLDRPFAQLQAGGFPTLNPLRIFSRNSFVSG